MNERTFVWLTLILLPLLPFPLEAFRGSTAILYMAYGKLLYHNHTSLLPTSCKQLNIHTDFKRQPVFFFLFSFLFLPSRRAPCILLAWCIELERAPKLGFPAAARAQKRPRRNKGEKTHYWAAILGLPALVEIQGGAGSTVQASP